MLICRRPFAGGEFQNLIMEKDELHTLMLLGSDEPMTAGAPRSMDGGRPKRQAEVKRMVDISPDNGLYSIWRLGWRTRLTGHVGPPAKSVIGELDRDLESRHDRWTRGKDGSHSGHVKQRLRTRQFSHAAVIMDGTERGTDLEMREPMFLTQFWRRRMAGPF